MTGGNINPGSVGHGNTVHYSVTFTYDGPVLCGSKDLTKPATSDPRYVSCLACFPLMTPAQRALREEQERRYPAGGGG